MDYEQKRNQIMRRTRPYRRKGRNKKRKNKFKKMAKSQLATGRYF